MQKFSKQSNFGFTIIEIVVVIGLITIFISLSYAGYATFTQRQKLISAGQTLKNILRDVQSRSFNNEADCSICNCTDPAVNVLESWNADLTQKQFYGVCQGRNFSLMEFKIPDEIEINSNNSLIQFFDNPPRVNTDTIICISLIDLPSRYYLINVSRSGDISDSGGLVSVCTI